MKKLFAAVVLGLMLFMSAPVSAHVVVKPGEVKTGSFQTFTVSVPNEKSVANTALKLDIPKGLEHVTPTVKQGWTITTEKEGEGEEAIVKSISWIGGSISSGFRDDFTFSAKVPAEATELQWKAFQTYEDGVTIAWALSAEEQPKKEDGSPDYSKSGPFSITKVVADTEEASAASVAPATSDKTSRTISIIALVVSFLTFAMITSNRKKTK